MQPLLKLRLAGVGRSVNDCHARTLCLYCNTRRYVRKRQAPRENDGLFLIVTDWTKLLCPSSLPQQVQLAKRQGAEWGTLDWRRCLMSMQVHSEANHTSPKATRSG